MTTLAALLETASRNHGERLALAMRAGLRLQKLTYADLEQRAHAFARLLAEHRVTKGDRVVIWAANQPDWVAAMFGCFIAGGVLVPLDVRSSREFVERVVARVEPVLALAGHEQARVLRELEIPVIELETANPRLDGRFAGPPPAGDDLAEIIFTSGTTGDPKGVMLTHQNIAANVKAGLAVLSITSSSRLLSLLPLSHMFEQVGGCFAPLAAGASICFPTSRQPASLLRTMEEWKPTMIVAVPQALTLFMNGIEREAANQGRLGLLQRLRQLAAPLPKAVRRRVFRSVLHRFGGQLDMVASGGAALDPELQVKWEVMGIDVVEGYGATECAPVVSINPRSDRRVGSVGKPLPGQQVRIAADGEVLVRGPNVFKGYWQTEGATQAAFEDDWYRTGDLGRIQDGYIYLKGRKKDLIVLADGQNVYPEDIERVLCRQPGVTDAVIIGVGPAAAPEVHAVLLGAPGAAAEAVRSANAALDDRQQIRSFTVWPEADFPRTHTLKVRKNLVQQFVAGQTIEAPRVAPTTAGGDELTRIIAQCSGFVEDIEEEQTLGTGLGLDSLGRVELLSAIEEEIGVFVDDTMVGPRTTVAELRAMILKSEKRPPRHRFPTWPRWRLVRWLRRAVISGMFYPVLYIGYTVEVRGRERFRSVRQPCLVVSNHNMHLDHALLLRSMPSGFRQRVAIAAAASDIFGSRFRGFTAALFGNAFPFAKEGSGVRESLENVVKMLDEGWNVLIFPEGKLTVLGPMQPFKTGIGWLAVDSGVPVVPMRIDVLRPGFYEGKWLPHPRARVRVTVGEPLTFPPGSVYAEVTARLEEAVRQA